MQSSAHPQSGAPVDVHAEVEASKPTNTATNTETKVAPTTSRVDEAVTEDEKQAVALSELGEWLEQNNTVLRIRHPRKHHILILKHFIQVRALSVLEEVVFPPPKGDTDFFSLAADFFSMDFFSMDEGTLPRPTRILDAALSHFDMRTARIFVNALPACLVRLDLSSPLRYRHQDSESGELRGDVAHLLAICGCLRVLNVDDCGRLISVQALLALLARGVLQELSMQQTFSRDDELSVLRAVSAHPGSLRTLAISRLPVQDEFKPPDDIKVALDMVTSPPPWYRLVDDDVEAVTVRAVTVRALQDHNNVCRTIDLAIMRRMTVLRVNGSVWSGELVQSIRISRKPSHTLQPLCGNGVCPNFSAVRSARGRTIRTLLLTDSELTSLHDSLSLLTDLTVLHVSNNKLQTLPRWLGALPNLRLVRAVSNPFSDPLLQRLAANTASDTDAAENLATFLRKRTESEAQDRLQLLVLGHGCVGKSTLVKALQTDRNTDSKLVAPLGRTTFVTSQCLTVDGLHFAVRDFPGQPQYYASNAHFLSADHAIVVVVCSLKDSADVRERQLRQWFSVADRLAQGNVKLSCRTIVVCTHVDQFPAEVVKAQLQWIDLAKLFPALAVQSMLPLNARDVAAVHTKLTRALSRIGQPLVFGRDVPKFVNSLRAAVDSAKQRGSVPLWLLAEDFLNFVQSKDVHQDEFSVLQHDARFALDMLIMTGDVLQIGSWVVCHPQWLATAMAAVVEPREGEFKGLLVSEAGLVERAAVSARVASTRPRGHALSPREFADRVLELLQILDIVIPVRPPGSSDRRVAAHYIIPSRLTCASVDTPKVTDGWSVLGRRFVCAAPHQFSEGLLPVLACRVHGLSPQAVNFFEAATREVLLVFDTGFMKLSVSAAHNSLVIVCAGPARDVGWNTDEVISVVENVLEEPRWGGFRSLSREVLCSHCVRIALADGSSITICDASLRVVSPHLGFGGVAEDTEDLESDVDELKSFDSARSAGITTFYCKSGTESIALSSFYGVRRHRRQSEAKADSEPILSWSASVCAEWLVERVPELSGLFMRHPDRRPTGAQLVAMTSQDLLKKLQLKGLTQRQLLLEDLTMLRPPNPPVQSYSQLFEQMDHVRLRHEHIDSCLSSLLTQFPADFTLHEIDADGSFWSLAKKRIALKRWVVARERDGLALEVLSTAWAAATAGVDLSAPVPTSASAVIGAASAASAATVSETESESVLVLPAREPESSTELPTEPAEPAEPAYSGDARVTGSAMA